MSFRALGSIVLAGGLLVAINYRGDWTEREAEKGEEDLTIGAREIMKTARLQNELVERIGRVWRDFTMSMEEMTLRWDRGTARHLALGQLVAEEAQAVQASSEAQETADFLGKARPLSGVDLVRLRKGELKRVEAKLLGIPEVEIVRRAEELLSALSGGDYDSVVTAVEHMLGETVTAGAREAVLARIQGYRRLLDYLHQGRETEELSLVLQEKKTTVAPEGNSQHEIPEGESSNDSASQWHERERLLPLFLLSELRQCLQKREGNKG